MLKALNKGCSMTCSREICKICFHVNSVGFSVPNEVWKAAIPSQLQNGVVCLQCFSRLADEKCISWDVGIAFFPVSMATHLEIANIPCY